MGTSRKPQTSDPNAETTQDLSNVPGADDPGVSSRAKDALFADAPRSTPTSQFQEPVRTDGTPNASQAAQPVDNVPQLHEQGDYGDTEDYDPNKTAEDADFNAPEVNRKETKESA